MGGTAVSAVDADVAACLGGAPRIGELDQAFLFLTAGQGGAVDVCLLSRVEVRVTDEGFAAVVASRRARANLADRPVATIVVVCGDELHTFTCDVTTRVETGEAAAYALAVRGHRRDGLGIELIPLRYRVAEKLRFDERWDRTEQLLQQLQSTLRPA